MNRYEKRTEQERRASLRSSMALWSAGAALLIVVILILGLSNSAPLSYFKKGAIAAVILLILLRQAGRALRKRSPKAAEPDPQSKLHLTD